MVCKKGPNNAHRFKNHICEYCGGDDLDFEREIIKLAIGKLIESDSLTTGVLSGLRREVLENRSIDRKLEKFAEKLRVDVLSEFAGKLDDLVVGHYCDGCDRVQDCDSCDDRKGDPPPYDDMG